jgi:hypothetical protein
VEALVADVRLDRLYRLRDQRLADFLSYGRHYAASRVRKSLGGTPKRRQKARLKLALFW